MNKMLKRFTVGIVLIALVGSSFAFGLYASELGWKDQAVSKATHDIYVAGEDKKNELLTNIDEIIEEKMLEAVDTKIDAKETFVEKELEDYFADKVADMMNPAEVNAVDADLNIISAGVVSRFKGDIDAAFANR